MKLNGDVTPMPEPDWSLEMFFEDIKSLIEKFIDFIMSLF